VKYQKHLLPFNGASLKLINASAQPAPVPVDLSAERAIAWAKTRQERIDAARASRATPTGQLTGSRYSGGFVGTARAR
jgi:hypothetical protein